MTKDEYNEAAALVVRLRKELEDATQDLSLHYDALKQSNAQCGEYLLHNEMLAADRATLHKELVEVRAALATVSAERDSLKRTLQEWEEAETTPHVRVDPDIRMGLISETGPAVFVRIGAPPNDDIADHVVPLCTTCHACGMTLGQSAKGPYYWCQNFQCTKKTTQYKDHDASPFWGPCKSTTPVRHE